MEKDEAKALIKAIDNLSRVIVLSKQTDINIALSKYKVIIEEQKQELSDADDYLMTTAIKILGEKK